VVVEKKHVMETKNLMRSPVLADVKMQVRASGILFQKICISLE